jgi:hypothetical protein
VIANSDATLPCSDLSVDAVELHRYWSYMRGRAPTRLRTHILWALVVLSVVFLHFRGRSLDHATATGHQHPVLTALRADQKPATDLRLQTGSRRKITAFLGVQACLHLVCSTGAITIAVMT